MADTATAERPAETTAPPEAPAPKSRKKLVVIIVAVVLVGGAAAKFTVLKPAPAEGAGATATTLPGGELVTMEPMSVNLADGHYLKIGVAIELVQGEQGKEFEKEGEVSKMRDLIISTASTRTMAELSSPEGKQAFKEALDTGGHELYEEKFHGVFLTDFVMQ